MQKIRNASKVLPKISNKKLNYFLILICRNTQTFPGQFRNTSPLSDITIGAGVTHLLPRLLGTAFHLKQLRVVQIVQWHCDTQSSTADWITLSANGERLVSQRTIQPVKNKSRFAPFWTWHLPTQHHHEETICPCFTSTLSRLFFCAKLSIKWFRVKHINHQNRSIYELSQYTEESPGWED